MILTHTVTLGVNYKNIEHFKSLNYDVKNGDKIEVPIEHLRLNSNIKIQAKCDKG